MGAVRVTPPLKPVSVILPENASAEAAAVNFSEAVLPGAIAVGVNTALTPGRQPHHRDHFAREITVCPRAHGCGYGRPGAQGYCPWVGVERETGHGGHADVQRQRHRQVSVGSGDRDAAGCRGSPGTRGEFQRGPAAGCGYSGEERLPRRRRAVRTLLMPHCPETGFGSVLTAGVLSIPGMMCTCCAAPVVVGLRERQASPGAAIAFWLGNSVLNPATLVFTGFVLGWNWTALRLALGIPTVFGLGYLVNLMVTPTEARAFEAKMAELAASAQATEDPGASNAYMRWIEIFTRMSVRLIPEYIVILLLGAARAWLFPEVGPEIGNEIGWIVALAAAGMLFVIPTAGEVPIIQAMLLEQQRRSTGNLVFAANAKIHVLLKAMQTTADHKEDLHTVLVIYKAEVYDKYHNSAGVKPV